MKQRNLNIDNRLKPYVEYNRKVNSVCIYCGKSADSKEHVPSKVFLRKPYPENLSIVPSCKECNNGYSLDEVFLYICVEKFKKNFYKDDYMFGNDTLQRFVKYKKIADEVDRIIQRLQALELPSLSASTINDTRIDNILLKLALGHAVYELSVGYESDCNFVISSIWYEFLPCLSDREIEKIDSCMILNGQMLPEIGSRAYENIYIINVSAKDGTDIQYIMLDWIDVQADTYRYTSYNLNNKLIVKIVISEFLFVIVTFDEVY